MLTNALPEYVDLLMTYAIGPWDTLFDLVCVYARKPAFFTEPKHSFTAWRFKSDRTVEVLSSDVELLEPGTFYMNGCSRTLVDSMRFLSATAPDALEFAAAGDAARRGSAVDRAASGSPHVLYFGDHLQYDVAAPALHCGWDVIAVVDDLLTVERDLVGAGLVRARRRTSDPVEVYVRVASREAHLRRRLTDSIARARACVRASSDELLHSDAVQRHWGGFLATSDGRLSYWGKMLAEHAVGMTPFMGRLCVDDDVRVASPLRTPVPAAEHATSPAKGVLVRELSVSLAALLVHAYRIAPPPAPSGASTPASLLTTAPRARERSGAAGSARPRPGVDAARLGPAAAAVVGTGTRPRARNGRDGRRRRARAAHAGAQARRARRPRQRPRRRRRASRGAAQQSFADVRALTCGMKTSSKCPVRRSRTVTSKGNLNGNASVLHRGRRIAAAGSVGAVVASVRAAQRKVRGARAPSSASAPSCTHTHAHALGAHVSVRRALGRFAVFTRVLVTATAVRRRTSVQVASPSILLA